MKAVAKSRMDTYSDNRRERYLEKPLPSCDDSERVILGSILIDNAGMAQVASKLTAGDFYSPFNRRVFAAMLELFKRHAQIDPILIGEELKKDGALEAIGGVAAITNLTYGLPHFSNLSDYIEIVSKKARLRDLIRTCSAITSQALAEEDDPGDVMVNAQTQINSLVSQAVINDGNDGFIRLDRVIDSDVKPALEALQRGQSRKISMGFPAIDAATGGGISTSDVILLAGLPSSGKSALALQAAFNIAKAGTPSAFLAGEMTNTENVFRILSQVSGMSNVNNFTHISAGEHSFLNQWADAIRDVPLYLDHRTSDIHNLGARLRTLTAQHGIKVLVVDYIQLLKVERVDKRTRFERITEASQELKRLANELDIAIICVAQFNREGAKSGKPTMHDLEASGQLEKDASMIFIIDREEQSENVTIRIVKGRNTGTGTIHGRFIGHQVRFELD